MSATINETLTLPKFGETVRLVIGILIGVCVTAGLFWFMQYLIVTADRELNEGGSTNLIDFVRSFASGFIFTTALPPALAAGATASIRHLKSSEFERARQKRQVARLRARLDAAGEGRGRDRRRRARSRSATRAWRCRRHPLGRRREVRREWCWTKDRYCAPDG